MATAILFNDLDSNGAATVDELTSSTFSSLDAAVAAAAPGQGIYLLNGTFELTSTLNITKQLLIIGQSQAGVIIDASAVESYGILVNADGVSLKNFTLHGPAGTATPVEDNYGIKVEPNTASASDVLANFTLANVTVDGSLKSEIDLNGVNGATLTNVTANGLGTAGVGLAMTDSANVTVTNLTTSGNNWGSVAIFDGGTYTQQSANIAINGHTHGEPTAIYSGPVNANAGLDAVTFNGVQPWVVYVGGLGVGFGSEAAALAFAGTQPAGSIAIEKPDGTFVVNDGMSIQAAINAASAGDTINVAAGTYAKFTVNKDNLSIVGTGEVEIVGSFRADNPTIPGGTSVGVWLQDAVAYNGNAGAGATIAANGVSLSNLNFSQFLHGVNFGDSDDLTLTDIDVTDSVFGVIKLSGGVANGFAMTGGSITDSYQGITIDSSGGQVAEFNDAVIDGVTFENLTEKGFYADHIDNAQLLNLIMTNVGEFGRGPAFGAAGKGEYGAGIDINAKYGDFSQITIDGFTFTDVGSSSAPDTVPGDFGAAITIKARDDAPSYSANPGTLNNVTISDGTIDGTSTGIRIGEPGKNNSGPTNVTVTNVTVTGETVADYDNASQAALSFNGTLVYGAADNAFNAAAGDQTIDAGAGSDEMTYTGTLDPEDFTYNPATNEWTVASPNEGTDKLIHFEKVTDGTGKTYLLVDELGSYTSIQAAIDAATAGDTILVAAGTYGAFNANKSVTIIAAPGAVVEGSFRTDNAIAGGTSVAEFVTYNAYTGAAGNGVTISANDVTIEGLTIRSFLSGIDLGTNSGLTLTNVTIDETVNGIRKGTAAVVTDFEMTGGKIEDTYIGMFIGAAVGAGAFDQVTIDGVTFEDLGEKGIYAEQLSNAQLINLVMNNVGEYGRGLPFGGVVQAGEFGAGIDINLKYGTYANIEIADFAFTDVGTSAGVDGFPVGNPNLDFGAAIVVKARNDAPSYNGSPASATGVTIHDGTIDGTSTGVRIGEPGTGNAGVPAVVTNVTVTNATVGAFENASQSTVIFPTGTDLGTGDDIFTGTAANETVNGGAGEDTAVYTGTLTAADFSYNEATNTWTVTSDNGGTDALVHFEKVTDGAGNTFLLVDLQGSYTTIQAAVDAAADGDTILVAAGTYDEDVQINQAVTIVGAKSGIAGSDAARDAATGVGETTLLGDIKIIGTSGNVTIDGVRFLNDGSTAAGPGNPALQVHNTASGGVKTITNSVFWSSVAGAVPDERAFSTEVLSNTDINFTNNLVSGSSVGGFGTASWGRGVWFDGGTGVDLVVSGTTFQNVRTGINADLTGNATLTSTGNTFDVAGTAYSIGVDIDGFTTSGNSFVNVGDEFNLRNIAGNLDFDLTGAVTAATGSEVVILGGKGNDTLTGSQFADRIDDNAASAPGFGFETDTTADADLLEGEGGNDTLVAEAGNDTLDGGAGNDLLAGGEGNDTAVVTGAFTIAGVTDIDPVTAGNQAGWSVTSADDTDTLNDVEFVTNGTGKTLLVGNGGFATIAEALALAVDGDTVMIAAGEYVETALLNVNADITIIGAGAGQTIIKQSGTPGGNEVRMMQINDSGVSISDLTFAGWTATPTATTSGRGYHIWAENADNLTIDGVEFASNSNRVALYTPNADNLVVTNSEFNGDYLRAVIRGGGQNMSITDNEFDIANYESGVISIENSSAVSGLISGNTFTHAAGVAVLPTASGQFKSDGTTLTTIYIPGNLVTDDGMTITGNSFTFVNAEDTNVLTGATPLPKAIDFDSAAATGPITVSDNQFHDYGFQPPPPSVPDVVASGDAARGDVLQFDGVRDALSFTLDQDIGSAGTLSLWMKLDADAVGKRNMIIEGPGDGGLEFQYRNNSSGQLYMSPNGFDSTVPGGAAVTNGSTSDFTISSGSLATTLQTWSNVQYTWEKTGAGTGTIRIYVNGTEVAYAGAAFDSDVTTWQTALDTIGGEFFLGRDQVLGDRMFKGAMDQIAIFDSVLSGADLTAVRNGTIDTVSQPSLVAFWDFEQGAASFDGAGGTTIALEAIDSTPAHPDVVNVNGGSDAVVVEDNTYDTTAGTLTGNLVGSSAADTLEGTSGNDDLNGKGGNDSIDGADGVDTATFTGNWKDYTVTGSAGAGFTLTGPDGTDTVENVEFFKFANVTATAAQLPNDAPIGVDDSAVSGNALGNDTDADGVLGDTLTVTGARAGTEGPGALTSVTTGTVIVGTYGDLTISSDGSYSYAVDASRAATLALDEGENASETFTYEVRDFHGLADLAEINLTVNGVNDEPVANDDTDAATEGTPEAGNVVTNDTDADGDTLTVTSVNQDVGAVGQAVAGQYGTLTLNADGSYSYVASDVLGAGDTGTDVFTYTVSDSKGGSDAYKIVFDDYDLGPIADLENGWKVTNAALDQDVVSNGAGSAQGWQFTRQVTSGSFGDQPFSPELGQTAGENGVTSSFEASWTFEAGAPQPGSTGSWIGVSMDDGEGARGNLIRIYNDVDGSWKVEVADYDGTNFVYETIATLTEGEPTKIGFTQSFADGASNDVLKVYVDDQLVYTGFGWEEYFRDAQPGISPVTYDRLLFRASGAAIAGDAGVIIDDVSVTTNQQATLSIEVTGTDDAPVITGDVTGSLQEDVTTSANGQLAITDGDAGEAAFQTQTAAATTYGSFSVDADGTWTYDLNNASAAVQAFKAGQDYQDSVVVKSIDGTETTIDFTIAGTNDDPVAVADTDTATEDGAPVNGSVATNDSDVDGDTLTYSVAAPPAGLTFLSNGSYIFNPSDAAYNSLADGETVDVVANYTVSDGKGGSASSTLTITVTGANDAPVAVDDTDTATEDGAIVNGSVATNDSDVDLADTLSFTLDAPIAGLTLNGDGSYSFDPSNGAYQDLAAGEIRDVVANYTVSDGKGGSDGATLTITVTGVNDAPTVAPETANATEDGADVIGSVADNVTDPDTGASHSYALAAGAPSWITMDANGNYTIDSGSSEFQSLAQGSTALFNADFEVTDDKGATAAQSLTLTVAGTNDAPTLTAISGTPVALQESAGGANDNFGPQTGSLTVNDIDLGNGVTGRIVGSPVVTVNTGSITEGLKTNLTTGEGGVGSALTFGNVTPNGTATGLDWTYDPGSASINQLSEEQIVTITYTVEAYDGITGSPTTQQIVITVAGTNETLNGTPDDDTLNGSSAADDINGLAGHDFITANSGDDDVYGGDGDDSIFGAAGNDEIYGDDGDDLLDGGAGNDTIHGGPGADIINGGAGDDTIYAGSGDDVVNGSTGNDTLHLDGAWTDYTIFKAGQSYILSSSSQTVIATAVEMFYFDGNTGTDGPFLAAQILNDAPVAVDDSGASGNALDNDTAVDEALGDTLSVTGARAGTEAGGGVLLTVSGETVITGTYGKLTIEEDGTYSYKIDAADADTIALGSTTANEVFTYRVGDFHGLGDTGQITISVSGVNSPPTGPATGALANGAEDVVRVITEAELLAGFSDANGDALSVENLSASSPAVLFDNGDGTWNLSLPANDHQVVTLTYEVSDGTGSSGSVTRTVDFIAVNDAPEAQDDILATDEDTALVFAASDLLANDSDVDGEPLTVLSVQGAVGGTVSLSAGMITFTPTANFNGPASFTYTVKDAAGATDTATVTVDVASINDAPDAVNDTRSTDEDTPLVIAAASLTGNDIDVDGDPLTVISVQGAVNGTVSLVGGDITFNPTTDFTGTASFTYTVKDPSGATDTATVTVNVGGANDAPDAIDDVRATNEDTPLVIAPSNLTANDTDPDSDPLTVTSVQGAVNGTVSLNAGVITFTPTANFHGVASFTYTVEDGNGGSDTATVTVNVASINDLPDAVNDARSTDEDTPLVLTEANLTANDTDADGDTLTIISVQGAVNGTVGLDKGSITFTPTTDFTGTASFTYTVEDGNGGSDTATVTIDVGGANDAPDAVDDVRGTNEDTPLVISETNLTANDTDPDGNPLTVTSVQDAVNGAVSLVSGIITFTPDADFNGVASFTYTVDDGNGGSDTATVTVNVAAVNDAPVANDDSFSTDEDTVLDLTEAQLLANDDDVDGDTLEITQVLSGTGGTAVLNLDGSVTFTPTPDYNGPASFTYKISDGTTTSVASATVSVGVNPVNDAPDAQDDSKTTAEDTPLVLTSADITGNDTDVDGDTLTVTAVGGATNGSVGLAAGVITFTADPNYNGPASFTYTVSDGKGGTDTATVTVDVTAVNDTATITGTKAGSVTEDGTLTTSGDLDVSDVDAGEAKFATPGSLTGAYGSFSFNTTSGAWDYTLNNANSAVQALNAGDKLTDTLTVKSFDNSATETITVTINGADEPLVGIIGDGNDNNLSGTAGNDSIYGLGGNDTLTGLAGADRLDGGTGTDRASYAGSLAPVAVSLMTGTGIGGDAQGDTLFDIEDLVGSGGGDTLSGNGAANFLDGAGGNDTLVGGDGNDTLDGGLGNDSMSGGLANDTYVVDSATDQVVENLNEGTDTVQTTRTSYTLGNNVENLIYIGAAAILGTGNALANSIVGGNGNDILNGLGGIDTLAGGGGNDTYTVDDIADQITEASAAGTDTVNSTVSYTLSANVENLYLLGADNIDATGNDLVNGIKGNSGNNWIDGGLGADAMAGGAGNDTYIFETVGDIAVEKASEGIDTIRVSYGYTLQTHLENLIFTGSGDWTGSGNAENNSIVGGAGNDTIDGKAGIDTMDGGLGNDVYYVDNAADAIIEGTTGGSEIVNVATLNYTSAANIEEIRIVNGGQNVVGNDIANIIRGNGLANTIDGGLGADTVFGGSGNDTFIMKAGQSNGDVVADFAGAGPSVGDVLRFEGYGAGTIARIGATDQYLITADAAHGSISETITLTGVTTLNTLAGSNDFVFA